MSYVPFLEGGIRGPRPTILLNVGGVGCFGGVVSPGRVALWTVVQSRKLDALDFWY